MISGRVCVSLCDSDGDEITANEAQVFVLILFIHTFIIYSHLIQNSQQSKCHYAMNFEYTIYAAWIYSQFYDIAWAISIFCRLQRRHGHVV